MKQPTDLILYAGLGVVLILLAIGGSSVVSSVWIKSGNRIYRDYSLAIKFMIAGIGAGILTMIVWGLARLLGFH